MITKKEVSVVILLALLTLTLPSIFAYEETIREDVFLVRPDNQYVDQPVTTPTYLQEEDLTFFACSEFEEPQLRLSAVCDETNEFVEIEAQKWGPDNCYVGSINLEELECSNLRAQAEYTQDGENTRLEQRIQINEFSESLDRIVDYQFTDGGWENALDTAHGLYVLNHFPELFDQQITDAIEYLKENRDEDDKCWPQEQCQISTTAYILFLLEQTGLENLRIQHDARLYLEREQNYISQTADWNLTITDHTLNSNTTLNNSCVFEYQDTLETITLPKNPEDTTLTINPAYEEEIGISCTLPVYIDLYNEFSESLVNFQGDDFTYTIPPACWTRNNERLNCDARATLLASNTQLNENQLSAAQAYLDTLLVEDRTAGIHVSEEWTVINDALYAIGDFTEADDVITALLYYQANSGAWIQEDEFYEDTFYEPLGAERSGRPERLFDEVTQTIINTGYATLALLENEYERDSEPIRDAERRISVIEDETSQNATDEELTDEEFVEEYEANRTSILQDPKRNAMAFVVLENSARPLLRTRPQVLNINQQQTTLEIINPTIFDLTDLEYELSEDLQGLIEEVEYRESIGAYSFRRLQVTLLEEDQEAYGYLRILRDEDEYLKLPVIISSQPELRITLPEQINVFGASTTLPFEVQKSNHDFVCSLEWGTQGISSSTQFNINEVNQTYSYPVRFSQVQTENRVYEGIIECQAAGVTIRNSFATEIVRFTNRPLQVRPAILSFNSSGQALHAQVTNLLDEIIEVTPRLREPDPYISIAEPLYVINPGETINATVEITPPLEENYSTSNALILETLGVEERVLINADIPIPPPPPPNYLLWISIVTIILALGGVGYYGYSNRESLLEWYEKRFHKEDIEAQVEKEVTEIETDEQRSAIKNMISIYKLQGIKDTEIRKKLINQGYSEQEIDDARKSKKPSEEESEEQPAQEK